VSRWQFGENINSFFQKHKQHEAEIKQRQIIGNSDEVRIAINTKCEGDDEEKMPLLKKHTR